MKKLFVLIALLGMSYLSNAQSCDKSCCDKTCCDKKLCAADGNKTSEAINSLRTDLESVITKLSESSTKFDKNVVTLKIEQGTTEDESLRLLSNAVSTVRYELVSKIDPSMLVASLRNYDPIVPSTKQQIIASLKQEIDALANQVNKL